MQVASIFHSEVLTHLITTRSMYRTNSNTTSTCHIPDLFFRLSLSDVSKRRSTLRHQRVEKKGQGYVYMCMYMYVYVCHDRSIEVEVLVLVLAIIYNL